METLWPHDGSSLLYIPPRRDAPGAAPLQPAPERPIQGQVTPALYR